MLKKCLAIMSLLAPITCMAMGDVEIDYSDYQFKTHQLPEYSNNNTPRLQPNSGLLKAWRQKLSDEYVKQYPERIQCIEKFMHNADEVPASISTKDLAGLVAGLSTDTLEKTDQMNYYPNNMHLSADLIKVYRAFHSTILIDILIQNGFVTLKPDAKALTINEGLIHQQLPKGYIVSDAIRRYKNLEVMGINGSHFIKIIRTQMQEAGFKESSAEAAASSCWIS
jgi:hypothetical protein